MKTIVLNGSPKGNSQSSSSYFLAKAFVRSMNTPCEIRAIAKEDNKVLAEYTSQFDNIIIILPNYIHSIPSGTLDFLNKLPPAAGSRAIGFIIQSGYPESSESEIMVRLFRKFAQRLGYAYHGTVVKGGCAGLAIMPKMFRRLAEQFAQFGALFEETGQFDEKLAADFAKPYMLSPFKMWIFNALDPISNSLTWHKFMKKNNAFEKRLDMPYLDR